MALCAAYGLATPEVELQAETQRQGATAYLTTIDELHDRYG